MFLIFLAILLSTVCPQFCPSLGGVWELGVLEGMHGFSAGQVVSQGMDITITRLNPEPLSGSGRRRVPLKPI
jgi:hypothetical protein